MAKQNNEETEIKVPEKYHKERIELKKKYDEVWTLKIPTNRDATEHVIFFLKEIDRETYSAVNKILNADDLKATQVLINSLWIGGDDKKILNDPKKWKILHAASFVCGEYLVPFKAELKKN